MSAQISILHIGLPMDHPSIPSDIRVKVEQGLKAVQIEMNKAGLNYQLVFYSPESGLDGFAKQLKTRPCDGVLVGGGVTNSADMTYFMEQIVDVTHVNAPQAKIMFIHEIADVHAAVDRWFKHV